MKKIISLLILCNIALSAIAAPPNWSVNPSGFQYTATLTGVLVINNTTNNTFINSPGNKVGAFVNGQVRGVANATTVGANKMYFVTLYSNVSSGENVTFKAYLADHDSIYDVVDSVVFVSSAVFGSPSNPNHLRINLCQTVTNSQTLTICAGQSVTVGSHTYTSTGTYTDLFMAASGCDSIVTTHLTVITLSNSFTATTHNCGTTNGSVTAVAGGSSNYTYNWSTGNTTSTVTGLADMPVDTLIVTITDTNACTLTDTAIIVCQCPTITSSQTLTKCAGQSVTVGSHIYTATGTYKDTLAAVSGCDSIITTHLTVITLTNSFNISTHNCGTTNGSVTAIPGGGSTYSYNWGTGNTTATVTGLPDQPVDTLIVTITDASTCTLTDTAIITCAMGIHELNLDNYITVYPNPAKGIFTLEIMQGLTGAMQMEIYNVVGEKIDSVKINSDRSQIDITNLPNGIYFLQIKTKEGVANKKISIDK